MTFTRFLVKPGEEWDYDILWRDENDLLTTTKIAITQQERNRALEITVNGKLVWTSGGSSSTLMDAIKQGEAKLGFRRPFSR